METIDLDIDEVNELAFKLRVEGMANGSVSARLYCESNEGLMHAFSGQFKGEPETVTFRVPQLTSLMSEGVYPAWIEVVVDNRQFKPAAFNLNLKKPVHVQVESVTKAGHTAPSIAVETVSVLKKPLEKKVTPPTTDKQKVASLNEWYKKERVVKK